MLSNCFLYHKLITSEFLKIYSSFFSLKISGTLVIHSLGKAANHNLYELPSLAPSGFILFYFFRILLSSFFYAFNIESKLG